MTDLLDRVGALARDVVRLARDRDLTLEGAFDHPDVAAARDDLLALLAAADTVGGLLEAALRLRTEFARLHDLPPSDDNLARMGAVAAAERALTVVAEARAAAPLQVFVYTCGRLLPYLEALARAVGTAVAAGVG